MKIILDYLVVPEEYIFKKGTSRRYRTAEGNVSKEADTGVMQPQAKEHKQPAEARSSKKPLFF